MNVENILKVADAIERHSIPDLGFNMRTFGAPANDDYRDFSGHNCGTVACIVGWTLRVLPAFRAWFNEDAVAHPFGISQSDWVELTLPDGYRFSEATSSQAVAVLRHLAATGKVDWSIPTSSQAA